MNNQHCNRFDRNISVIVSVATVLMICALAIYLYNRNSDHYTDDDIRTRIDTATRMNRVLADSINHVRLSPQIRYEQMRETVRQSVGDELETLTPPFSAVVDNPRWLYEYASGKRNDLAKCVFMYAKYPRSNSREGIVVTTFSGTNAHGIEATKMIEESRNRGLRYEDLETEKKR